MVHRAGGQLQLPILTRPRAVILALTGVEQISFGAAILAAAYNDNQTAVWIPQIAHHIASVPEVGWGYVWVVVGVSLLGLCWWRPASRYLFSLSVLLHTAWGIAWLQHYLQHGQGPGDWAPATAYLVAAGVLLIISGWPDP